MIGMARPLAVDPDLSSKLVADSEHRIVLRQLTTGIAIVDHQSLLNITWYEHQLKLIANGRQTNPGYSTWLSVLRTFGSMGLSFFTQRRRA